MRKIIFTAFLLFFALTLITPVVIKPTAFADTYKGIAIREFDDTGCLYKDDAPIDGDDDVVKNVNEANGYVLTIDCVPILFFNLVFWALTFAGLVALLLVIFGGFKYMTSGGDQKAVEGGKKTITWAIIGLVVILLSFAIVRFIADITGLECLTRFGFIGTCGP